jgi:excisionase family DNA binding protein
MENQVLIQKTSLSDLKTMISDTIEQYLSSAVQTETSVTAILTRKQAANMLNISLPTLHCWTKEGVIKGTRIGTRVRYRLSDIEAALVDIQNLKYKRNT